ncbi:nitroreductase family protein [Streptomyces sp. NPDC001185]|uniref:Acg family FMN-binding oxidoreductase n=1 Tax=Streptomyces sp. NPDC001185 TaxID=3154380 RepID=UPI003324CD2E
MSSTHLDSSALEKLISAAVAAPSMHNTQPWRFRFDTDSATVEIHAGAEWQLPQEDPQGRALHISAGAALFNLRVAVTHLGWKPITRLLPDPHHPALLATARICPRTTPHTRHGADLYAAIWHRHSSRFPFTNQPVPEHLLHELAEAAHSEGITLAVAGPDETARLLQITAEAERRNHIDAARGAESRRWSNRGRGEDTGIPFTALGPQDAFEQLPMRDFSARRSQQSAPARPFERTPLLVSLSTGHDRRTDWLRAGQALERVLLVATAHGLRTSLLHQALEWSDLRDALRSAASQFDHVQMLLRLGYGPEGSSTPRRSPRLFLDLDGSTSQADQR